MTDQLRQAAQQALVALIDAANVLSAPMFADAVDALRTALEQQAEPIGWLDGSDKLADFMHRDLKADHDKRGSATPREFTIPLYAAPAQRQWVGLTDEEMSDTVADIDVDFGDLLWKVVCLTKIIEAKLKEKNT